ncbi:MAG: hypothetical protein GWN01_02185 [Nitrosopumilaceae archaeon]|nr:hypothetical protein [Nitrosopumilaceae archaeon]NIX60385.1 hypothetical protein [Nitrosopumilaceae archaeon]
MPKGVYKHKSPSEETRKKLSEALKGRTYEEMFGVEDELDNVCLLKEKLLEYGGTP